MKEGYLLSAKNIDKSFVLEGGKQKVLDDISIDIEAHEFVCLVGPSGCGKSTLLRAFSGLSKPDHGSVTLKKGTKLAFVFQSFGLFPWLTVEQNIGFGLKMEGRDAAYIKEEVRKRVIQMGLDGFETKHPKELSGGMKQRVGIARALAVDPDILLLDEPFSALDVFTAEKLRQDLLDIWKYSKLTIIMVSHLVDETVELADRVIVLSSKPGKIKKEIKIKLSRPRKARSEEFYKYVDELSELVQQK
jgi:ABC-type nitrate/sulfonate/bicarbonate transport system ATPase subunit